MNLILAIACVAAIGIVLAILSDSAHKRHIFKVYTIKEWEKMEGRRKDNPWLYNQRRNDKLMRRDRAGNYWSTCDKGTKAHIGRVVPLHCLPFRSKEIKCSG
jgi:hypothetical protein